MSDADPRLGAVVRLAARMHAERDLGVLLDLIAREAASLTCAERASIFLLDRNRKELWSKVALGSDETLRFPAGAGIAGAALETGRVLHVEDAYGDPRFHPDLDQRTGFRTRNLLAIPLRNAEGDLIGVFEVLNKRRGPFTGADKNLLKVLASHAATALETAQLVGDLEDSNRRLEQENLSLRREIDADGPARGIIGCSERIQNILRLIDQIRDTLVEVLITGESGTGKELVARAIHAASTRASKPLVALNCAALPETLVESELFGVERGVATGVEPRAGQFERAHGGTLFLDEIGDLSLASQAKILRVLQERVLERVGGRKQIRVDVRILAATNKDLEEAIRKSSFREDLFFRLNVIRIHTPALREVREDIPLLAGHFLEQCCREMDKPQMRLSAAVIQRLMEAPWPGNARQLRNEIKRLVAFARGTVITERDLDTGQPESFGPQATTLGHAVAGLESGLIRQALRDAGGNQVQAARSLGLSRQGLINKMKRYGIRA